MFRIALDIFDHFRRPPAVAREIAGLRRQISRISDEERFSAAELSLAREMLGLRLQLGRLLEGVHSCATCARGLPAPRGIFDGGDCCSSPTHKLFSADEQAALWASGTRPRHLRTRATLPAGCAFRGPRGCSLTPRHRPSACTSYLCPELSRELHARGELDRAEALSDQLKAALRRFEGLRRERLLSALLRPGE